MGETGGKIISQAYEVIKKTYKEVERLKDDLEILVSEIDPSLKFDDEYSYGPKSLYLRNNHTFLFRKRYDEGKEHKEGTGEIILGIVCIFSDESDLHKVSLKDQPEIWFGLITVKNRKEKCRPWDIYELLNSYKRKGFKDEKLIVGGEICIYHWSDEEKKEQWGGKFVGYPLVTIGDVKTLKAKAVDMLFSNDIENK